MGNSTLEMIEREEPRFVKFATGEIIEGTLLAVDALKIKDKTGVRYTVQLDSGELVGFLGTFQINTKLRREDRGHRIRVTCVGEDTMVKRGENCMKVFDIAVSKQRVTAGAADALEIGDDDIPF
jgi:hypothetical protein